MRIWVSKEASGPKDYSYPPYKPKKRLFKGTKKDFTYFHIFPLYIRKFPLYNVSPF